MKKDEHKTKKQLINELLELRRQITEMKVKESEIRKAEEVLKKSERKQAVKEIEQSYDTQRALNTLLNLSLKDIPLEELLNNTLDLILSIPWLSVESKGSIFIVEDNPEVLIMKTQIRLSEPIQKLCAIVPFGRCICGRAALTKEMQFADHIDDRHETLHDGMLPHGHYCIPIIFERNTLGVINLYLREGHHRNPKEDEFLILFLIH
ncbi:MAG: GAF domain-containing protein [Nitrospirota bacterium]|nr:GAF domain-containing protein [Nitrospirota bacterium]